MDSRCRPRHIPGGADSGAYVGPAYSCEADGDYIRHPSPTATRRGGHSDRGLECRPGGGEEQRALFLGQLLDASKSRISRPPSRSRVCACAALPPHRSSAPSPSPDENTKQTLSCLHIHTHTCTYPADLRRHQQEGVNWMAFLMIPVARHPCDDMGLGKTLQSISIMASSHHNRRVQFAATKSASSAPYLRSCMSANLSGTGHLKSQNSSPIRLWKAFSLWARRRSGGLCTQLGRVAIAGHHVLRHAARNRVSWGVQLELLRPRRGSRDQMASRRLRGGQNGQGKSQTAPLWHTDPEQRLELWSLFDFLMPGFLDRKVLQSSLLEADPRLPQC